MSVQIESVSFADESKRLVLGNAQWAATLAIGTSWTRLRIGARIMIDDLGSNITGTPRLYLGVASDPSATFANGPLSGTGTKHFLGFISSASTWTRNAGPPVYYSLAAAQVVGKKVGSTITMGTGNATQRYVADSTRRWIYFVEIDKTGGSPYTVYTTLTNATTPADQDEDTMINAMEVDAFASAATLIADGSLNATVAVDEVTDGDLNAICCAWDRNAVDMHASEMFFAKME